MGARSLARVACTSIPSRVSVVSVCVVSVCAYASDGNASTAPNHLIFCMMVMKKVCKGLAIDLGGLSRLMMCKAHLCSTCTESCSFSFTALPVQGRWVLSQPVAAHLEYRLQAPQMRCYLAITGAKVIGTDEFTKHFSANAASVGLATACDGLATVWAMVGNWGIVV